MADLSSLAIRAVVERRQKNSPHGIKTCHEGFLQIIFQLTKR